MAKGINILSDRFISKAPAGEHFDGDGLVMRVSPKGKRVWFYRFRFGKDDSGKDQRFTIKLGQYPALSLKEARAKRAEGNGWREQGLDPRVMWQKERDALNIVESDDVMTFGRFAELELPRLTEHLVSDKSHKQWYSTIRTYAAPLWQKPIADITDKDVAGCLADHWTSKHETMKKTRARLELIFRAAKKKKHRTGDNPATLEDLEDFFAKPSREDLRVRHHPTHNFRDMPQFFEKLAEREATSAKAFMFKILCAARTNEVRMMKWSEVDFHSGNWSLPPERMKAGRPHLVPLSADALDILESIDGPRTGYVFKSENRMHAMSNGAMLQLIKRMGEDAINRDGERVSPHGCARSGFKDWAVEVTEYDDMLSEVALAHVDTKVKQAYRRESSVEQRRRMMQDWADFLHRRAVGKVVQLWSA